ncbi:hypothetical protein BST97_03560 [Nonlabens spongiae]|uniref:DUF4595 domain-containing protein n=1 Tax=Nonlabens spongiae TaxID=331648 RepID=A0A1W6MI52_9FLAO|nr:hypothetical protein [Nonlabens spongiae]ARN77139.1 hypothetical protein BST97_03560 [Nonlabens spongiae]
MNKLSLIIGLFIGSFFVGCTSDDNNSVIDDPQEPLKQLVRIESTESSNGMTSAEINRYFEDGKLKVDSIWNANGDFQSKRNYTYNSDGVIISEIFENEESGLTAIWNYTYDGQGRVQSSSFIESEPGFPDFERNFEYSYISNTLVEARNTESGDITQFNFSSEGLLLSRRNTEFSYKDNNDIETINYGGVDNEVVTVNYLSVPVNGGFSRLDKFYEGNIMNFLIDAGEIPYAGESYFGARNLITSRVHERNGFTSRVEYQHTLDGDGYLIEEVQTSVDYDGDIYSSEYFYE